MDVMHAHAQEGPQQPCHAKQRPAPRLPTRKDARTYHSFRGRRVPSCKMLFVALSLRAHAILKDPHPPLARNNKALSRLRRQGNETFAGTHQTHLSLVLQPLRVTLLALHRIIAGGTFHSCGGRVRI